MTKDSTTDSVVAWPKAAAVATITADRTSESVRMAHLSRKQEDRDRAAGGPKAIVSGYEKTVAILCHD